MCNHVLRLLHCPIFGVASDLQCTGMQSYVCVCQLQPVCVAAVNVSVPEEMDAKLTKDIIEEYGLKASASMVSLAELSGQITSH